MSSIAKENAERHFRKQQEECAKALTEYQAKEEATRQLTAKLRAERLARETSSNPEGVRKKSPNRRERFDLGNGMAFGPLTCDNANEITAIRKEQLMSAMDRKRT